MVIYKRLFQERDKFSGSEAIVYSTLVNISLLQNGGVFDFSGHFDKEMALDYINDCRNSNGCPFIDFSPIKYSKMEKMFGLSKRSIIYVMKSLHQKNVLYDSRIYCPESFIDEGYLKIAENTTLKGWQLVFYSLIKERAEYYGGKLDTYCYRLAELFETTERNIYFLINALKSKGYIERDSNGDIVVK